MDKQARGLLLVEQEEAQAQIKQLTARLATMGKAWKDLSDKLVRNAENVVFTKAPDGWSNYPPDVSKLQPFVWDDIPDKTDIAQVLLALKEAEQRLFGIHQQLAP